MKFENTDFSIEATEKNDRLVLMKVSKRSGIKNFTDRYTLIDQQGNKTYHEYTHEIISEIFKRLEYGISYSSALIFSDVSELNANLLCTNLNIDDLLQKSETEHKYTSTGIKFWRHQKAMNTFRNGIGYSIISTHISPEGRCNLKCPYCSVVNRKTKNSILLDVIKDYILKLKSRGLKAVILTGGGEPTLYENFNKLVEFILGENLQIALITNGTTFSSGRIDLNLLKYFTWIRISINIFEDWEDKIWIPKEKLGENTILGFSMICTAEHDITKKVIYSDIDLFKKISALADRLGAKYIRLLPNCLLSQKELMKEHNAISKLVKNINDPYIFHQKKIHRVPKSEICHLSYFRPYLSEEIFSETGVPGTVFPCDSLVLNDSYFNQKYALCAPHDILHYLDRKFIHHFNPQKDCTNCVFTDTINMLDDFRNSFDSFDRFIETKDMALSHENFV